MKIGITTTTVSNEKDAKIISTKLINNKLVACCQLSNINSIYRWKGTVQEENEVKITVKHPIEGKDLVIKKIAEIHPYDTPEIIFFIAETTEKYGKWCINSCS